MSFIGEYDRKPIEKSENVKIACWQPALIYMSTSMDFLRCVMGVHNVTGVLWPKHSCVKYLLKSLGLKEDFQYNFRFKSLSLV